MLILPAIALLIQLLPQILGAAGVVSPAIAALIQQLGGALPGLITSLATGQGPTDDIVSILRAFQQELAVLQSSTKLDPIALAQAATLDAAVADAIDDYERARQDCDPSTLTPLPVIL